LIGGAVLVQQLSRASQETPPLQKFLAQALAAPWMWALCLSASWGVVWLCGDFAVRLLYQIWGDAPEIVTGILGLVVIAGLSSAALAAVIGLVRGSLGFTGLLVLTVIWGGAGLLGAAIVFVLFQFGVNGDLLVSLLFGLVGGAPTAWYVSRRLGRPASLGLIAASGAAWAGTFAASILLTDTWSSWTNHFAAGAVAALGSLPLCYHLSRAGNPPN
jgi:hypothetical protein